MLLQMLFQSVQQFLPILILILVVGFVLRRLPKVDLGHSSDFIKRRTFNWLPLGLTYALLYMGRYNLTVAKNALGSQITNADFGTIFGVGTWVYGCSFLLNGPLTDRWGGRATIMISAVGSLAANIGMGILIATGPHEHLIGWLTLLYAVNMYFQSFGAVSIVKVNAAWFHIRERGTFGGIFGILISLGIYLAFDVGSMIVKSAPVHMVFFIPAALLAIFTVIDYFSVFDTPGETGHKDFDPGDATGTETGQKLSVLQVATRMFTNPAIITIALIEFCSGFLRNAVMQWYIIFAKQTGQMTQFIAANWGMTNCIAGILGGVFAGTISDKLFHSRRGPVSSILYGLMLGGSVLAFVFLTTPTLGWVVSVMMLSIIGVHGMLSGTASMDFGGKKNVGIAVGLIDGMVYLGTGLQAIVYGSILPSGEAAKDPANWANWPIAMIPVSAIGLLLALRLWNARPTRIEKAPQPDEVTVRTSDAVPNPT